MQWHLFAFENKLYFRADRPITHYETRATLLVAHTKNLKSSSITPCSGTLMVVSISDEFRLWVLFPFPVLFIYNGSGSFPLEYFNHHGEVNVQR